MLYPVIEFKPIEGDTLFADVDFDEIRAYLGVESVAVHAEVTWRIAETNQSWNDR